MNSFLNFLTLAGEMTSYGAPGGMDAHSAAADRAKDCSAGEPVSFLPWLQNHSPRGPFVSVLDFLSLSVPASRPPPLPPFPPPPPDFLTANFLSFFHKFCCLFSSLCVAVLSYQTTSEIALPFLWDCLQVSLLTFIPSSFLPSPSDSRLFFHLEKKCQIDTVEDLKPGMSLTWLSCLLVKLQSFLC